MRGVIGKKGKKETKPGPSMKKGGRKMNKIFMVAFVALLSIGLVASASYARGPMGKGGFMTFNSMDLIGATVKDSLGQFVGIVNEVMVDSGGNAFAIVNRWDYGLYGAGVVNIPVPIQELRISQTKREQDIAFLKMDNEHLNSAPYLNPNLYEYYGIQPFWTQSGTAGKNGFMELNSFNLVGSAVENSCGKVVGVVNEVMIDSGGHAFAIIYHGDYDLYGEEGVNTPVPLQDLRISQTKGGQDIAFLKTDMEHLDLAPYLNPLQMNSRQYEASIYVYYGIQPYWTQSGELSK